MIGIKTLLSVLTLTASMLANAQPAHNAKDISLSSLVGDVVCPKGQTLFHASNEGSVPRGAPGRVWTHIGDFGDVSWLGFDLVSETGTRNKALSTRTTSNLGMTMTEQLDLHVGSPRPQAWERYFAQSFSQIGTIEVSGVAISNVRNLLIVSAGASGRGANIAWETIGCSTNTKVAATALETAHGGAIAGAISHFAPK